MPTKTTKEIMKPGTYLDLDIKTKLSVGQGKQNNLP